MHTLLPLLLALLPARAEAVGLEHIGEGAPGVSAMWQKICAALPFCDVGPRAPELILVKVSAFIFGTIAGVAVIVIVYAAIKMILPNGSEEGINEAKKILMYALSGLVLAILAEAIIIYFMTSVFGEAFI